MATKDVTVPTGAQVPALITLKQDWEELAEVFRENIGVAGTGASPFVLPRLRVPAGGITAWQTSSGSVIEKVSGIIASKAVWRGYWPGEYKGGKTPPQCVSNDGVIGTGNPGGECAKCRFNQWGTAEKDGQNTRGKACKDMRAVFFINDEAPAVPTLILLPPTSAVKFDQKMFEFAGKGALYWKFYVELSLNKASNSDGIAYGELEMKELGRISKEDEAVVRSYRELIAPFTDSIIVGDFMADEAANESDDNTPFE